MKNYEELINEIVKLNEERNIKLSVLPHCSNLLFQLQKSEPKKLSYFEGVVENYLKIRRLSLDKDLGEYIEKITEAVNNYMNIFWPPKNNPFSHQADFGSSIIPEMLCLIFGEIIRMEDSNLEVSAQKDLIIECIFDFTDGGSVRFKKKRVDLAVVKNCKMTLDDSENELPIPLMAIECKTNLDKNMLSGIEFSVGELKKTFPECKYLVVTELSDFNVKKSNYASSEIDEIYVLRQQKRAEARKEPHPRNLINSELVKEIAEMLDGGIKSINQENDALNEKMKRGKLIGR